MKKVLLLLLMASGLAAQAQKSGITGQVLDSLSGPLPSATVMLLNPKDSSLVNFGVSDARGVFEMKNISKGEYQLKITFVGFAPFSHAVSVTGNVTTVDVGKLKLMPMSRQLDELVIQGDKAPVNVKRDTIEFNAGSFKTKANANVEDLLKKLPGVEVETDGTIRAQGEQVQRVTVDGREFFGRDPKLATRNLPADAVDKVQVFDKKSDQAVFSGIEDGQRDKTINLELKAEKRHGAFGNIMGGIGTDGRYQAKANVNRFEKKQQLSFLGMGNNVNEQGFSIDDFMNFTGGSQQMMAGGGRMTVQLGGDNSSGVPLNFGGRQNGIMTNYAGGVNFNRDFTPKAQMNSSYFYNRLEQDINRSLDRINYLPNGQYEYTEDSRQNNTNDNHRVNLTFDQKLDSSNSIKSTNSFNYAAGEMNAQTHGKTMTVDNTLQNESNRLNYNAQTAMSLNSTLLFRHRFAKKGRTFSTNLALVLSQTNSRGNLQSTNDFYTGAPEKQEITQNNTQDTDNQSYGATFSYTEPLGGRKYLEANYNIRTNQNEVDREVFDVKNGQEIINAQLTNKYNSNYLYNRPGLNFRMNRPKYNLSVGASWQNTRLKGNLILKDVVIDRTFENLLPVAHFNYDFSNLSHFRFDYETSMQEPTIQQLQPVVDNSDPLNLSVGNPNLKPAYTHRLNANFITFDPAKFISFFGFISAAYTANAITYSQTVNQDLVRLTMPVNTRDNQNISANLSLGFPVKKIKSRFNVGPTGTIAHSINVLNGQDNPMSQQTFGGTARYNYTYKELVTLDLSANLSHQQTNYEFNAAQNQAYFNKTYSAELNVKVLKNYQLNSSYNYYVYNSETTDFHQNIPLLNIWLSRFLLKNNTGELKVGVNNVLDQSMSVSQTANANYLQQETTNNLGRYFMVSFTYALNKQLNPMGGHGPGGRMMMIRQ